MNFEGFIGYSPLESDQIASLKDVATEEEMGFGIVKRRLAVKNAEDAGRYGKRIGVYTTYDCTDEVYTSIRAARVIENVLVSTVKSFVGYTKSSAVLVVGLGNGKIAADSLGQKVFDRIEISGEKSEKCSRKHMVCAISTSVFGKTGIESARLVFAVVRELKPKCVLLVDSLATNSAKRVGKSFQLSTAGLSPGGGVGKNSERIDKDLLGVPVLSIGVPTLITLSSVICGAIKDYSVKKGCEVDEYLIRSTLMDKDLSAMVVAPKNVDAMVDNASVIVSNAINLALAD